MRGKRKIMIIGLLILMVLPFISATHFITGIVNDAKDGTIAEDRTIVLWNPANGISDNLTDIIGVNGSSGADNVYFIDCELLSTACAVGDEMRVQVFNEGDDYVTYFMNLTVTGFGFDVMDNLTLNSPPNVSLVSPINYANISLATIDFNCSYSDLDSNTANVTLYGNWTGSFHANETQTVSGNGSVVFSKVIDEGRYNWSCFVTDDLNIGKFAEDNYTLTVDRTEPTITTVLINESFICGSNYARINCTVTDSLSGIADVIIEATRPEGKDNYTATLLSGDTYFIDLLINETGVWNFTCYVNDSAGNVDTLLSQVLNAYTVSADLVIYFWEIVFDNLNPIESEGVIINATIHNNGCTDANNFPVGFFNGNPDSGGVQINGNQTISVEDLTNTTVNITWSAEIGHSNIFVVVDNKGTISESNESNNEANSSINVGSWQDFYGNISADRILSSFSLFNMSAWANESNFGGNIYIADSESIVDWFSLQAIGFNISNDSTSNDFSDIDNLLNMTAFNDSVTILFQDSSYRDFTVHQTRIENVSVINSTNNTNFITGILWDMDDDVGDGEYSQDDMEDLVFLTNVNEEAVGAYGLYDYEFTIPVKLREYNNTDISEVYLYYDLF